MVKLRLQDIQGNILPGFRTDHQGFIFIRFAGRKAGRRWLDEERLDVTSGADVATGLVRRGAWLNVAFSWQGLASLGAPAIDTFPPDFREGLRRRAKRLGDRNLHRWRVGGAPRTEAHALVLVAANAPEDLEAGLEDQQARCDRHGLETAGTYRGTEFDRGFEHFGYRDGLSQPVLEGTGAAYPDCAAGEFILGYPDAEGETEFAEPGWARDGSYLVFRRLTQHVARFRRTVEREAAKAGLTPDQLRAKLMGRWPSGARLGDPLEATDPGWDDRRARIEEVHFGYDPDGWRFPLCAHIRKAYPRDVEADQPWRHRLLRRGIPYGAPLPEDAVEDDGVDRGLLFVAYQASIARQFEHIQARFNNPRFPAPGTGPDPFLGRVEGRRRVALPGKDGRSAPITLDEFVEVTGGGYFFSPSLPALTDLANPGRGRRRV